MHRHAFALKPFPGDHDVPDLTITGTFGRRGGALSVLYALRGDLPELAIPAARKPPARAGRLWEETCLEFFLGARDSEGYWEFHLSPSGDWNAYRFASYREGMQEEPAFASLPFRVRRHPEALELSLDVAIGRIVPAAEGIDVGVCAVIRTLRGGTSHWALAHPGPRPDFHRRDGFMLRISAA